MAERHYKQGYLVKIVWFWMCGTIVVHMFVYVVYVTFVMLCAYNVLHI